MCEVNIKNFKQLYPKIKKRLEESKFFSVDLEFSALNPLPDYSPSLFDTSEERYLKLKHNLETVIPLQVGLTAFTFNPDNNTYIGRVYTFYVQPASFQYVHKNFFLQTATLNFLKFYDFDFNKFAYEGIPYINNDQESELKTRMFNEEISEANISCKIELDETLEKEGALIRAWYEKSDIGDFMTVPKIYENYHANEEILYFIHKSIRALFDNNLWTYIENKEFIIKKVSKEEYRKLLLTHPLDQETVENLLGFTKIFRLLISMKKPIVGHNLCQDLVLMINSFYGTLPTSYKQFKKEVAELFPCIFDTKSISYELRPSLEEAKRWDLKNLDTMFVYFKHGTGRLLASNSPAIEIENNEENYGKLHDAGWDSFCTGYVFLRLAHLKIYNKYPLSKKFVFSEYVGGLAEYKNRVNIIRGSITHINLDKDDPKSTRPPYLVIESIKNRPFSVQQIMSLLSPYGFVELRKLPHCKSKALIAVDNYGNARRILENFKKNEDYRIKQYNVFKHSHLMRIFLAGSLSISSALILWLTFSIVRR